MRGTQRERKIVQWMLLQRALIEMFLGRIKASFTVWPSKLQDKDFFYCLAGRLGRTDMWLVDLHSSVLSQQQKKCDVIYEQIGNCQLVTKNCHMIRKLGSSCVKMWAPSKVCGLVWSVYIELTATWHRLTEMSLVPTDLKKNVTLDITQQSWPCQLAHYFAHTHYFVFIQDKMMIMVAWMMMTAEDS